MRKSFTLLILLLAVGSLTAQQFPQYTMFSLNRFAVNPAYAGLENSFVATGVYRQQWVGIPNGPTSQRLNAHSPIGFLGGGLGVQIENETLGAERHFSAGLTYSYQVQVGRKGILSFGLTGAYVQKGLDGALIRTPDGNYEGPTIEHNDQLLTNGLEQGVAPTFHWGTYYQGENIEAGIAVYNLLEQSASFDLFNYQLNRTYVATLSGDVYIGRKWQLKPSVLLKSIISQTQIDFSAIVQYNDNIFGGASFRGYSSNSTDALGLIAGFNINEQLTLAYAYDLTLSPLQEVSNGSHEVIIRYDLGKPIGKGKLPPIIYNPRLLD